LDSGKLILAGNSVGTLGSGNTYTGTTGLIQSGRNGGAWNGSGIVTSQTDATAGNLTTSASPPPPPPKASPPPNPPRGPGKRSPGPTRSSYTPTPATPISTAR